MAFPVIALAAAQAVSSHHIDPAAAQAAGYAQAQAALAGTQMTPTVPPPPISAPAPPAGPMPSNVVNAVAPGGPRELTLTCVGAGTANKETAHTAYTYGSASGMVGMTPVNASGSATTTVYGMRQQGFEDQVDIRLFGGDDRIRMPRTMLPMFHGGSDGWFKLKNVKADARAIHASVAVNFINNPKVYIDRVTGTISISGKAGDYSGECQVIDASAAPRF